MRDMQAAPEHAKRALGERQAVALLASRGDGRINGITNTKDTVVCKAFNINTNKDQEFCDFSKQLGLTSIRDESLRKVRRSHVQAAFDEHSCHVSIPPRTAHWYEEFCQAGGRRARERRSLRGAPPAPEGKWYAHGNDGHGEDLIMPHADNQCFKVNKHGIIYDKSDCPQLWKRNMGNGRLQALGGPRWVNGYGLEACTAVGYCQVKRTLQKKKTLLLNVPVHPQGEEGKGIWKALDSSTRLMGKVLRQRKPRVSKNESDSEVVFELKNSIRLKPRRNVRRSRLPGNDVHIKKTRKLAGRKTRVSVHDSCIGSNGASLNENTENGNRTFNKLQIVIENPLKMTHQQCHPVNSGAGVIYGAFPQGSHIFVVRPPTPLPLFTSLEPAEPLLPLLPSRNPMQTYLETYPVNGGRGRPPKVPTYWGVRGREMVDMGTAGWTYMRPDGPQPQFTSVPLHNYTPAYVTNCNTLQGLPPKPPAGKPTCTTILNANQMHIPSYVPYRNLVRSADVLTQENRITRQVVDTKPTSVPSSQPHSTSALTSAEAPVRDYMPGYSRVAQKINGRQSMARDPIDASPPTDISLSRCSPASSTPPNTTQAPALGSIKKPKGRPRKVLACRTELSTAEPAKKVKGRPRKVPPNTEDKTEKKRTPRKQQLSARNGSNETEFTETKERRKPKAKACPNVNTRDYHLVNTSIASAQNRALKNVSYILKHSISVLSNNTLTTVSQTQPLQSDPALAAALSKPLPGATYRRLMRRDPDSDVFQPITGFVKVPDVKDADEGADELMRAWRTYVAPRDQEEATEKSQWAGRVGSSLYKPSETSVGRFSDSLSWHPAVGDKAAVNSSTIMYRQAREFQHRYNQSQRCVDQSQRCVDQSQHWVDQSQRRVFLQPRGEPDRSSNDRSFHLDRSRCGPELEERISKHQDILQKLSNECATVIDQRHGTRKRPTPNILQPNKRKKTDQQVDHVLSFV